MGGALMRAPTARSSLRSTEREWRAAPNAVPQADCPRIAGFLADVGESVADNCQTFVERPTVLALGAIAAVGLFVCSRMGLLA